MKKENLLPIILVSISCVLLVIAIILLFNSNSFKLNNHVNKNEETNKKETEIMEDKANDDNSSKEQENVKVEDTSNQENSNNNSNKAPASNNEVVNNSNNNQESSSNNTQNQNASKETIENEDSLVAYFESESNLITTSNQEDSSLRLKAKTLFTNMIDFIFYGKEIKGYTFSGLTNAAKLKIIKLALTVDHKIDEYFPDYKEVIKDKYTSMKGKLALKYLEFSASLCNSVGSDTCNQAKEDFNTMKNSFGFTWQLVKELASTGSSKVKELYEAWRDSE